MEPRKIEVGHSEKPEWFGGDKAAVLYVYLYLQTEGYAMHTIPISPSYIEHMRGWSTYIHPATIYSLIFPCMQLWALKVAH